MKKWQTLDKMISNDSIDDENCNEYLSLNSEIVF